MKHGVCERDSVCEVAVCKGDDGRHAGTRNRMSECHDMCEHRDTQECVCEVATGTATVERQGPSSGRSCFGNRAGFARQRARGSGRAVREVRAVLCTRPPRARLRE